MAKGLGKKASNIFVWAMLALLLVGLAGFGITSFSGGASLVGRIGSAEITAEDYARALDREIRSRSAQSGQALRLSDLQAQGIDVAVLQGLIGRAALISEANEMGLSAGDEEVARQIRAIPDFAGSDGEFSREAYEFALAQNGYDPSGFERGVREDTIRSVLQYAVVVGIGAPELLVDRLTAREVESRDFTIARVTEADLAEPPGEPTGDELADFHEANSAFFELPERRRITYAWIAPEAIMEDMEIDEEVLRGLYEDRIDDFVQPERRIVERLVYPSQEEAEAARARLDAGEVDFDTLVEERGLSLDDIDMGDVAADDLTAAAAEAVFADDAAEIVGPVDSAFGPALFRINAVLDASEVPFEAAAGELGMELQLERARRTIAEAREPIDDALAGGATLEELAEDTLLELGTLDYGPGTEEGIAAYDGFRDAAEEVQEGDFPELLDLSDGGLFALRLDEIVPPEVPPLTEIRDEVAEAWAEEALREALESRAQDILTGIATEGAALEDQGLELVTETDIARQDFIPDVPAALVPTVFDLSGAGDMVVIPGAEAALIVRLDAIRPGNRNDPEVAALLDLVDRQVSQSLAQDMFASFGNAMDAAMGIELNQGVINGVHANFP